MSSVPNRIKSKAVHIYALNEYRWGFDQQALTQKQDSNYPVDIIEANFIEIGLPGAHSDIGGSYPFNKSVQYANNALLASPPLALMVKHAKESCVPLEAELSDKARKDAGTYDFVDLYEARAKRIAATYARFYLELEEGGEKDKIGRYYWMALGAFASKTVACLLGDLRVQMSYAAGATAAAPKIELVDKYTDLHEIGNGLGKGNLWLFIDIASSHWLYNNHPEHFSEGMKCEINRDSSALHAAIQKTTDGLPWAAEVLPKLNNLDPSADIIEGFKKIAQFEETTDERLQPKIQLASLLAIAEHEQGAVLQPLIYDDPKFSKWCRWQREVWILNFFSPAYKIVFARTYSTKKAELENHAPDTMAVEAYDSRMSRIEDVAKQFQ
jgi:hypothetical protein